MTNLRNFGIAEGRLTTEPVVLENKDGSKKVKFTLAVQNKYKNKEGKRDSQYVQLDAFVPAGRDYASTPFNYLHKGALVAVGYDVRSSVYEKDGESVFAMVLNVNTVEFKESKDKVESRLTKEEDPANPFA